MIDWGAYFDGSMDSQTATEIERKIDTDPSVRRASENYRAFVWVIQDAGRSQPVPLGILNGRLDALVKPKVSPRWVQRWSAFVATLAVLGVLAYVNWPDSNLPQTPVIRSAPVTTEKELNSFLKQASWKPSMPTLKATSGELRSAHFGRDWVAVDYRFVGHQVTITARPGKRFSRGSACRDGELHEGKCGTGFEYQDASYYVTTDADIRDSVAYQAYRELNPPPIPKGCAPTPN